MKRMRGSGRRMREDAERTIDNGMLMSTDIDVLITYEWMCLVKKSENQIEVATR